MSEAPAEGQKKTQPGGQPFLSPGNGGRSNAKFRPQRRKESSQDHVCPIQIPASGRQTGRGGGQRTPRQGRRSLALRHCAWSLVGALAYYWSPISRDEGQERAPPLSIGAGSGPGHGDVRPRLPTFRDMLSLVPSFSPGWRCRDVCVPASNGRVPRRIPGKERDISPMYVPCLPRPGMTPVIRCRRCLRL